MRISDWSSDVCSSDLWAGVPYQHPQAVKPVGAAPGQKCQCAGVGLVGFDAAAVEQPHVGQRTEQRSPVGPGHALFQASDVADEYRSDEHTSEIQSLMSTSYAVFCLKTKRNKKKRTKTNTH